MFGEYRCTLFFIFVNLFKLFNYWLFVFNQICTPDKRSPKCKLFYERKSKFYSWDRYENLSPLNNRINFIIVNCLQHEL